jgi:uncharacterized membrane protein YgcG
MKFLPVLFVALAFCFGDSPLCCRGWAQESSLLPVPEKGVLDEAKVFQPEAIARLESGLEAAHQRKVRVYILTLTALNVEHSKQQAEVERLAKRYVEAWSPNEPGAVLVFDDQSGLMGMEVSKEARDRFSDVTIHFKLIDALQHFLENGLSRDKLERAALTTAEVLVDLETQYEQEKRRRAIANTIMGVLALIGVVLVIRSALAKDTPEKPFLEAETQDENSKTPPSA